MLTYRPRTLTTIAPTCTICGSDRSFVYAEPATTEYEICAYTCSVCQYALYLVEQIRRRTEVRCQACAGTGFPIVNQPARLGRRIYPAPCQQCMGKGRVIRSAGKRTMSTLLNAGATEPTA
jgi:hypothetical protein